MCHDMVGGGISDKQIYLINGDVRMSNRVWYSQRIFLERATLTFHMTWSIMVIKILMLL